MAEAHQARRIARVAGRARARPAPRDAGTVGMAWQPPLRGGEEIQLGCAPSALAPLGDLSGKPCFLLGRSPCRAWERQRARRRRRAAARGRDARRGRRSAPHGEVRSRVVVGGPSSRPTDAALRPIGRGGWRRKGRGVARASRGRVRPRARTSGRRFPRRRFVPYGTSRSDTDRLRARGDRASARRRRRDRSAIPRSAYRGGSIRPGRRGRAGAAS